MRERALEAGVVCRRSKNISEGRRRRQRLRCVPAREVSFRAAARPAETAGIGGSIYLEANPNDNTLLRYRYNREFKADRGRHGEGSNCTGHSGEDMILQVPVGTLVV